MEAVLVPESERRWPPGDLAIWIFILAELSVFAIFFGAYAFRSRLRPPVRQVQTIADTARRSQRTKPMSIHAAATLRSATVDLDSARPASHSSESAYLPQANEVPLFEHAYRNRLPVLIKGPTGCGKTRFVRHMAERLGRPLYTVACHDDLTAADLVGRHLIGDRGTFWSDGPLTRAVREGAVCYLDEVVEARKDTTVVLHPLTDDRRILPLERTGETLAAPPEFMLVVSYNPGYQNLLKGLKPSTRQRFVALSLGFPAPELETRILVAETGIDRVLAERLVAVGGALRALKDHDLDEGASTRLLVYAATLIRSGLPTADACRAALIEPLTDDPETVAALTEVVHAALG